MGIGRGITGLLFAAGDYMAIILAELAALSLRNWIMDGTCYWVSPFYLYVVTPLLFMGFIYTKGLYLRKMLFWQIAEKLFHACLYGILLSIVLLFAAQVSEQVSRLYVGLLACLVFPALLAARWTIGKTVIRRLRTPLLIVGAGLSADAVVREIRRDTGMEYHIIGFLEDSAPKTDLLRDYPVLGGFDDLEKVVKETGVQSILIAAPGLPQEELAALIYRAQTAAEDVGIIPNLVAVPMSNVTVETFFDEKIMVLHVKNNLAKASNRLIKRAFDIVMTIVGGILISPILIGVALWVYRDSPGPIIYKHRRIGKDGKEFDCYKFRSMCVDSAERLQKLLETDPEAKKEWETSFKLKNDPRITRSGHFLRKTSLDELPQLLNVLKGEMSLVGPRPIVKKEIHFYGDYIKDYYMVRPGITGMWQTSGRSDIDYPERVHMDSWYVHNWCVWIDIVMLWRTVAVVLAHKGAY